MLHLLTHECPACGGPHRSTPGVPSAAELRPFFATYTPSKFPPATATQHSVTGSRITWGTTETDILSFTVDITGFWWAACFLLLFSGSGDNTTVRLRMNGTQMDSNAFANNNGARMLFASAPTSITVGQIIKMTAQNAVNPANQDETRSVLLCGFSSTAAFPH